MEKKIFRRITYVSKGSDVTLRNALGTGIATFQACLGKPIVIGRRGTVTQLRQRVAIGLTRKFKDKRSAYKALKNSQEWCSTVTDASHSITKEVIKKINKKMYIYSILDHFQIIQFFMQCISKTTQIDTLRCVIFNMYAWADVVLTQQPKAVVLQRWPLFAWIEEADQNPQIVYRDDPQEAQMPYFDLTQLERVHTKASSKIKRKGRSVAQRRMPRETEKHPVTMIGEKPTGGTSTSKKDQDGHGMVKSENFYKGSEPRRRIQNFLVKMVMEWWMLIFLRHFLVFRTHVVATTVYSTKCVHSLTCSTHMFLHRARA